MKQLLNSSFVVLCMLGLLVLSVVNTFQMNAIERGLIENQKALTQLATSGVKLNAGTGLEPDATAQADESELKEALADPNNILKAPRQSAAPTKGLVKGGTLKVKIGSDPRGMNPYIANGADVSMFATYIKNSVAERHLDDPGVFGPSLALKVTTPNEGLTYVVSLRKGVYWHKPKVDWESGRFEWLKGSGPDGRHELTSDDFKFVFEMLDNPQVQGRISSLRNYFESLDRVEVIDRYTFKVVFKERLFANKPMVLDLQPLPRWLYQFDEDGKRFATETWGLKLNEHWYNQKMIGTGPFEFVTWEPGVKIEIERNDFYFGDRPNFDRVRFFVVKDQNAYPRKLKTGELDITNLQAEQYRTEVLNAKGSILGNEKIKYKEQPTLGYFYLGWNLDSPYFNEKAARQAMTLAFNRQQVIDSVFSGLGKLTTGPFAQQSPCYDDEVTPWPFDLDLAAKKLDEAGWKDSDGDGIRDKVVDGQKIPFEFTMLVYGGSTEYETLASIYREDLLQVGVKLNPRPVEWSTMLKKMDEREFDAYTGAWVLSWETDLVQLWHSSEADKAKSSNRIGFRNKEADRIAETLRRTFDDGERTKLCHQFHALLHEEQPYTFIYQRNRPVLYWEHLNNPEFSLLYPYRDVRNFSFNQRRN